MDDQAKRKRRTYSDEFRRDALRLVVEEGYSFRAACEAVESRRSGRGELLHHSDRGCRYTSECYQRTLKTIVP